MSPLSTGAIGAPECKGKGCSRSCLVDPDNYLLPAYRYIELNPVRAAMVENSKQHHWSSVHANLALCESLLVTLHPCFIAMGDTPLARAQACRTWLAQGISDDELTAIRQHLRQKRAPGNKRLQVMAEQTPGRQMSLRRPGRPRRAETEPEGM